MQKIARSPLFDDVLLSVRTETSVVEYELPARAVHRHRPYGEWRVFDDGAALFPMYPVIGHGEIHVAVSVFVARGAVLRVHRKKIEFSAFK